MSVLFTKDHEWVRVEGNEAVIGITDYAQNALGDVVFVEVPEAGRELESGDEAGVVESVKAASEVYSPLSGEVVEGNSALEDEPSLVNSDPMGDGWFFKMTIADERELEDLMDEDAYSDYCEGLD